MKKLLIGLVFLFPSITFAATDDQIRASLTQQLLSIFVVQVNGIDKMQSLVAQSSNPQQFDVFSGLLAQQLSETTAQLAKLLNPDASVSVTNSSATVPQGIGGAGVITQGASAPTSLVDTPACIDNPQLNATLTEAHSINWTSVPPYKYVKVFGLKMTFTSNCGGTWSADVENGAGFSYANDSTPIAETEFTKNVSLPQNYFAITSPVAGTFTISVSAHNADRTVSTATTTLQLTSPGIFTQ